MEKIPGPWVFSRPSRGFLGPGRSAFDLLFATGAVRWSRPSEHWKVEPWKPIERLVFPWPFFLSFHCVGSLKWKISAWVESPNYWMSRVTVRSCYDGLGVFLDQVMRRRSSWTSICCKVNKQNILKFLRTWNPEQHNHYFCWMCVDVWWFPTISQA